ncbi:hypothetical protein BD560DRAFT_447188 [Blakeslea trispora]|nr:hypothetical protein BD560DRAFT_447188 [Blakeslea trispora]
MIGTCLVLILATSIFYQRTKSRKIPVYERNSIYGHFSRPKPLEFMMVVVRIIGSTLLVTNTISNTLLRAFLYDVPWQCTLSAFVFYFFGIAHTVSNNDSKTRFCWMRYTSKKANFLRNIFIIVPCITNSTCAILAAFFAERHNVVVANALTQTLCYLWAVYYFALAWPVLFAGIQLLGILNGILESMSQSSDEDTQRRLQKLYDASFKVRMIATISTICLFSFAFMKLIYGLFRAQILTNQISNLLFAIIWTFVPTLVALGLCLTVAFNPKAFSSPNLNSVNNINSIEVNEEDYESKTALTMTPASNNHLF